MAIKLPKNVEKSAGWPSGAALGWAEQLMSTIFIH
jgi:hypothetical protein